ncbi:hypothetical protein MD484_g262, partial [Candolleomyces efflorescens]
MRKLPNPPKHVRTSQSGLHKPLQEWLLSNPEVQSTVRGICTSIDAHLKEALNSGEENVSVGNSLPAHLSSFTTVPCLSFIDAPNATMIIPEKPPLEGPAAAARSTTSHESDVPPPYYPNNSRPSHSYPPYAAGARSSGPSSNPNGDARPPISNNAHEGRSETNVSSSDATANYTFSTVPSTKAQKTFRERLRHPSRKTVIIVGLVILAVDILAIFIPIYFVIIKPRNARRPVQFGTDRSMVVMDDGSQFIYENSFGGYWVHDPEDPYNDSARPNWWTPPLNTTWDFATNRIHGVNLAGLFVLDPFVTPALFQKYPSAVDEWTLSLAMAQDTQGDGIRQLESHYRNFITEVDIAHIAATGLTWVRLPIGFWAIETFQDEPFLPRVSWKYVVPLSYFILHSPLSIVLLHPDF